MIRIKNNNEITLTRGDTGAFTISCVDLNEAPVLFPGAEIVMTVKPSIHVEEALFQVKGRQRKDGLIEFIIRPQITEALSYGKYYYDVQVKQSNDMILTIVEPSVFRIAGEVTYNK